MPPPPIEIASDPFAMSAISAVNINTPEDTDIIMINGSYYAITVNSYGMPITNITNPAFPIRVSHVPLSNLIQVVTIYENPFIFTISISMGSSIFSYPFMSSFAFNKVTGFLMFVMFRI